MATGIPEALNIRPLVNPAFSHENSLGGVGGGEEFLSQSFGGRESYLEGFEIPIVDPYESGSAAQRPLEFCLVMNFNQGCQSCCIGQTVEVRQLIIREDGNNEQDRIGSPFNGLENLPLIDNEVLAKQRQLDSSSDGLEILERSLEELLVGEY